MTVLDTAIEASRAAGALLLQRFREGRAAPAFKDGQSHNVVTAADLASEELIVSLIRSRFPDHAILAEEGGASAQSSEYLWVVDPLDATNNFAHGIPHFAVSIALFERGVPLVGVIFDPTRGELFRAERGAGAFLDDRAIRVSAAASLPECIVATGFYYDRGAMMRRTLRQMERCFDNRVLGIRRLGSATLDLCWVACGRFDGFWELQLGPWDYAAGAVIVTEAGGIVTDVDGRPFDLHMGSLLASNGHVHGTLAKVLSEPTGECDA